MKIQVPVMTTAKQPYLPIQKASIVSSERVACWFKDEEGKLYQRWIAQPKHLLE